MEVRELITELAVHSDDLARDRQFGRRVLGVFEQGTCRALDFVAGGRELLPEDLTEVL